MAAALREAKSTRNPFTPQEDTKLVNYLARYHPNKSGRLGNAIYERLEENIDGLWPWSKSHPWRSWRERYKKNEAEFDYRIKKILKKKQAREDGGQEVRANASSTNKKPNTNTNLDSDATLRVPQPSANIEALDPTAASLPTETRTTAVTQSKSQLTHAENNASNPPAQVHKARKSVSNRQQYRIINLSDDEDEDEVTSHLQTDEISEEEVVIVGNRVHEVGDTEEIGVREGNGDSMDMDSRLHRFRRVSDANVKTVEQKRKSSSSSETFEAALLEVSNHLSRIRKRRKLSRRSSGLVGDPSVAMDVDAEVNTSPSLEQTADEEARAPLQSTFQNSNDPNQNRSESKKDHLVTEIEEAFEELGHKAGEDKRLNASRNLESSDKVQAKDPGTQTNRITSNEPEKDELDGAELERLNSLPEPQRYLAWFKAAFVTNPEATILLVDVWMYYQNTFNDFKDTKPLLSKPEFLESTKRVTAQANLTTSGPQSIVRGISRRTAAPTTTTTGSSKYQERKKQVPSSFDTSEAVNKSGTKLSSKSTQFRMVARARKDDESFFATTSLQITPEPVKVLSTAASPSAITPVRNTKSSTTAHPNSLARTTRAPLHSTSTPFRNVLVRAGGRTKQSTMDRRFPDVDSSDDDEGLRLNAGKGKERAVDVSWPPARGRVTVPASSQEQQVQLLEHKATSEHFLFNYGPMEDHHPGKAAPSTSKESDAHRPEAGPSTSRLPSSIQSRDTESKQIVEDQGLKSPEKALTAVAVRSATQWLVPSSSPFSFSESGLDFETSVNQEDHTKIGDATMPSLPAHPENDPFVAFSGSERQNGRESMDAKAKMGSKRGRRRSFEAVIQRVKDVESMKGKDAEVERKKRRETFGGFRTANDSAELRSVPEIDFRFTSKNHGRRMSNRIVESLLFGSGRDEDHVEREEGRTKISHSRRQSITRSRHDSPTMELDIEYPLPTVAIPPSDQTLMAQAGYQFFMKCMAENHGFSEELVRNVYDRYRSLPETDHVLGRMKAAAERAASEGLGDGYEEEWRDRSLEKRTRRLRDLQRSPPDARTLAELDKYSPSSATRAGVFRRLSMQGRRGEALEMERRRAASPPKNIQAEWTAEEDEVILAGEDEKALERIEARHGKGSVKHRAVQLSA